MKRQFQTEDLIGITDYKEILGSRFALPRMTGEETLSREWQEKKRSPENDIVAYKKGGDKSTPPVLLI